MTTFFLVLIYLKIAQSSVVVPTDRVVVAGQRMEMECRSDSGTKVREWTLQRPSTKETLKVFSNFEREPNRIDPKFEHFGADVDISGSGIIYSNSTRLTDAGVYTCRVQEGQKQPVPYSAQLVVLEKEPVCATNLTSGLNLRGRDKIWFQCSVNFSGNWAPNIEWRQHCGDSTEAEQLLNEEVETIIANNSSITSTLILATDSSRSSCKISCKIDFSTKNSNTINTTAPNTTDFSYVWRPYEIQVSTGFRLSTWDSRLMSDVSMSHLERGDTTVLATVHSIPAPESITVTVLIAVLTVVGLVVMVVVACCVCCVCYKKKVTELLIQLTAFLQGGTMESNREKRLSRSKIPVPRPPKAYTPMQISSSQRPTFQGSPTVQLRFKEQPREAGAVFNQTYSIVNEEAASSYATLSRGIQPPNDSNIYSKKCISICDRKAESTYATITDSIYMKTPNDTFAQSSCAKATPDGAAVTSTGIKATDGNSTESACFESTYSAITDSVYADNTDDIMYDVVRDV